MGNKWVKSFTSNIKYSKHHHTERETLDFYQEARETGTIPGTTCKLQFLGDGGAGKTSLINKLVGRKFNQEIGPTFGIETNMSKVSSVEANGWQEKDFNSASGDYIDKLSWVLRNSLKKRKGNIDNRVTKLKLPLFFTALGVFLFALVHILGPSILTMTLTCIAAIAYLACRNWEFYRMGMASAFVFMFFYYCNYTCSCVSSVPDIFGGACIIFSFVGFCFIFLLSSQLLPVFAVIWCLVTPIKSWSDEDNYTMAACLPSEFYDSYFQQLSFQFGLIPVGFMMIHSCLFWFNSRKSIKPVQKWLAMSSLPIIVHIVYTVSPVSIHSLIFGIFYAFGINIGISPGHKVVSFMLRNLHPMQYLLGCVSIFIICIISIFTHIALFQYSFEFTTSTDVVYIIRLLTIALIIAVDLLELYNAVHNPKPFQDVYKTIGKKDDLEDVSEDNELAKSFHLWDFAGQYFYYNTHQTFVAKHAVCLLVFNLTWFAESKNHFVAFARIRFWLQSILSHTKGPIFLVGTHLDQVTKQQVTQLQEFFERHLRGYQRKFDFRIKQNGKNTFFAVNNTSSSRDTDDVRCLQNALKTEAGELPPMKIEHPIRWWQFLIYANKKREEVTKVICHKSSRITNIATIQEAFPTVQLPDLINILIYFRDIGEILYSERKQIVGLDPQLLIDAMYTLTTSKSVREDGFWYPQHIKSLLTDVDNVFIERILSLLESKDLICEVQCSEDNSSIYLVPFLLPDGYPVVPRGTQWGQRFYVDFGEYGPHAVLSRLMARCSRDSDMTEYKQGTIYRQGGLFTLSNDITYMITYLNLSPEQYLLEVSVKTVPETSSVKLLQYLCNIMRELHQRDFRQMSYTLGVRCPHMAPHYGCPVENPHFVHVIPLASSKNPDPEFVEGDKLRRLCINREVEIHIGLLHT